MCFCLLWLNYIVMWAIVVVGYLGDCDLCDLDFVEGFDVI